MESWSPETDRERLAAEIAHVFQDEEQVTLYLAYCQKYPLALIQQAFAETQRVPDERIKKSRAALFFYLVKKYAHEDNQDPGH